MNRILYKRLIKAQLKNFNRFTPLADSDYAMVLGDEKKFKQGDVVKIERVVDDFAFVRKYLRSKSGWVEKSNLEKIKMVASTSDNDEKHMIPVRVEEVTTLSRISDFLFKYLGKRSKEIFGDEFVEKGKDGDPVPTYNPKVVIGEFLPPMGEGTRGFVSKWGEDTGVVYVNSKEANPDEVIAHEFNHLLSFYSKELAEGLGRPELQLGVYDEEMDEKAELDRAQLEQKIMSGTRLSPEEIHKAIGNGIINLTKDEEEDYKKVLIKMTADIELNPQEERFLNILDEKVNKATNLSPQDIQRMRTEKYFNKPSEMFAHAEQIGYYLEKFKDRDIRHVELSEDMDETQKKNAINDIKSRKPEFYKREIMNRFVPFIADKYKIKDNTARRIYDSIFDNFEYYIPNIPKN